MHSGRRIAARPKRQLMDGASRPSAPTERPVTAGLPTFETDRSRWTLTEVKTYSRLIARPPKWLQRLGFLQTFISFSRQIARQNNG